MKAIATASMPCDDSASPAATTLASDNGSTTEPSAAMRSTTSSRWRRGTSGAGLSQVRSNMSGIRMRPISSTSRKPRVVIRPVRAPLRCRMVLEPTVVPCSTSAMAGIDRKLRKQLRHTLDDGDAGIGRRRGNLALMDQAGIGQ